MRWVALFTVTRTLAVAVLLSATLTAKTRGARRRGRNGIATPSTGGNLLPTLGEKFCSIRPEHGGDQALHPLAACRPESQRCGAHEMVFPSLRSFLSRAPLLSGRLARQGRGTR